VKLLPEIVEALSLLMAIFCDVKIRLVAKGMEKLIFDYIFLFS